VWESTATLCLLGGARSAWAPTGRRGAGAYCVTTRTACFCRYLPRRTVSRTCIWQLFACFTAHRVFLCVLICSLCYSTVSVCRVFMFPPRGIKRWCCLTSVCLTSVAYIRSAGGVCGRPTGWRILADRARLGLAQGCHCALPLQAWAWAYRGRPPTPCLFYIHSFQLQSVRYLSACKITLLFSIFYLLSVDVGGALEILFVLYCIVYIMFPVLLIGWLGSTSQSHFLAIASRTTTLLFWSLLNSATHHLIQTLVLSCVIFRTLSTQHAQRDMVWPSLCNVAVLSHAEYHLCATVCPSGLSSQCWLLAERTASSPVCDTSGYNSPRTTFPGPGVTRSKLR